MADTVTVYNGNTGGTNYTVATDDITIAGGPAGQVQWVKLVDGTPNGTAPVGGTADGLYVTPHQDIQQLTTTFTVTAVTYAVTYQIGNFVTLGSASRNTGGSGSILGVSLVDSQNKIGSVDVVLFSGTPTASITTNNQVFNVTGSAEQTKIIDIISLNYSLGFGNFKFARLMGLNIPYKLATGETSLYAALIARSSAGAYTAGTPLSISVYVARD